MLLIDTYPLYPTATSVRDALDRLAARLEQSGTSVARSGGRMPDLAKTAQVYVELLAAFYATRPPPDVYRRAEDAAKSLPADDESLAAFRLRGFASSHRDWILASRSRGRLRQQWQELFKEFDVVLCPAMPTPAFLHDHIEDQRNRRLDIDGKQLPYRDQIVWASIATLCGLPATVAPIDKVKAACRSGSKSLDPIWRIARRSLSPG